MDLMGTLGHVVAQWLRHYTTRWKVAGSSPVEVIDFFDLLSAATCSGVLLSL
jgi:hypothetical protein